MSPWLLRKFSDDARFRHLASAWRLAAGIMPRNGAFGSWFLSNWPCFRDAAFYYRHLGLNEARQGWAWAAIFRDASPSPCTARSSVPRTVPFCPSGESIRLYMAMNARCKIFIAVCLGCASRLAWADFDPLLDLLVGEYNNNEQVWQQGLDGVAAHVRRHWRFERMAGGRLGLAVADGQAAPNRGWTLAFAEDDLGIRSAVASTDGDGLDCRYRWRSVEGGFAGAAEDADGCRDPLPAVWRITSTHLLATYRGEEGERTHQARRAQPYEGWIALQRRHVDPQAAEDDYIFLKDLRLHNEGFIVSIQDGGQPTGYAVELARLTYQNTRTDVLKLGVIDQATGKTLSYSWAEPGAKRIGINLCWIQAGLTKAED